MTKPDPPDAAELVRLLGMKPVMAIAPHPDDVALSVGGLLRLIAGSQVVLLTVFSRSRWAPLLACQDADTDRISRVRRSEDRRYALAVGAELHEGGMPDSSARGLPDMAWMRPPGPDDPLRESVRDLVEAALRDIRPGVVLCPLALGFHVDHVLVRDATLAAASAAEHVVLYEDIPYAAGPGSACIAHHVHDVVTDARPLTVDIASVYPQKVADVRLYASQIRPADLAAMHAHAGRTAGSAIGRAERVWTTVNDHGARRG